MSDAPQQQQYPEWGVRLFALGVVAFVAGFVWFAYWVMRVQAPKPDTARAEELHIDSSDPKRVAIGKTIYEQQCAACHGANLEGQSNWRQPLPNGRAPAPPHDESGHTWHHPDRILFGIVKHGVVPPYGPPGYQSDMPAFAGKLSDEEIRATLAYIESHWPSRIMQWREEHLATTAKK